MHIQSYRSPGNPQPPIRPAQGEIAEALYRAVRHGRPDLARRLQSRLVDRNRSLVTFDIADSAIGGGH